jgi:hypothetical protein
MGIGINTGPMILGVVGGRDRMQCSVVGDTANVASRIEQLTKVYRAPLLIGEHTFRSLPEPSAFAIRMVDRVALRGKSAAIELYEVIDADAPERRAAKLATRSLLGSAMQRYYDREFRAAWAVFKQISSQDPSDAVPVLFAERCFHYLNEPPAQDWKGFEQLNDNAISSEIRESIPPTLRNVPLS